MDANLRMAQEFRLEHRHGIDAWSPMEPIHHDSAAHDGERSWLHGLLFRCRTCDETVTITAGANEGNVVDPAS